MQALSVKQPFAGLIAAGTKRLEIRSWQTDYRGPLLICAGLTTHSMYVEYDVSFQSVHIKNQRIKNWYSVPFNLFKIYGCAVCVVDLVGIRPFLKGSMSETDACIDHIENTFAWEFENVRLVDPLEIKGKLRLFNVDDSLIKCR